MRGLDEITLALEVWAILKESSAIGQQIYDMVVKALQENAVKRGKEFDETIKKLVHDAQNLRNKNNDISKLENKIKEYATATTKDAQNVIKKEIEGILHYSITSIDDAKNQLAKMKESSVGLQNMINATGDEMALAYEKYKNIFTSKIGVELTKITNKDFVEKSLMNNFDISQLNTSNWQEYNKKIQKEYNNYINLKNNIEKLATEVSSPYMDLKIKGEKFKQLENYKKEYERYTQGNFGQQLEIMSQTMGQVGMIWSEYSQHVQNANNQLKNYTGASGNPLNVNSYKPNAQQLAQSTEDTGKNLQSSKDVLNEAKNVLTQSNANLGVTTAMKKSGTTAPVSEKSMTEGARLSTFSTEENTETFGATFAIGGDLGADGVQSAAFSDATPSPTSSISPSQGTTSTGYITTKSLRYIGITH
jgi:hypothetical protein